MEIQIPHQKHYPASYFPLVLSPSSASFAVSSFAQAIKAQKSTIDSLILNSGAILFRGFPVEAASDFNDVVEAFGYEEFPYVGGAAPRSKVVGRVFTANESPPDQKIPFHHELAQVLIVLCLTFFEHFDFRKFYKVFFIHIYEWELVTN